MIGKENIQGFIKERSWNNSSVKKDAEASQLAAARISQYCDMSVVFDRAASDYVKRKGHSEKIYQGSLKPELKRVRSAIEEAFYSREDAERSRKFVQEFGREGEMFLSIGAGLSPHVQSLWDAKQNNVSAFGDVRKFAITMRAGWKSRRFTPEQKGKLFEESGYTTKEVDVIKSQIAKSFVLAGASGILSYGLMATNAGQTLRIDQIQDFITSHAELLRAGTYATSYVSAIRQDIKNYELNKHEDIQTSFHPLSTTTLKITEQLFPGREWPQKAASIAMPFLYRASRDLGIGIVNTTDTGTAVIVSNNITATIVNLAQSGVSDWIMRNPNKAQEIGRKLKDRLVWVGEKSKEAVQKITRSALQDRRPGLGS